MEYFNEYQITILAVGLVGLLMFIQLVIADVVALAKKHVPGYPVEHSHSLNDIPLSRILLRL